VDLEMKERVRERDFAGRRALRQLAQVNVNQDRSAHRNVITCGILLEIVCLHLDLGSVSVVLVTLREPLEDLLKFRDRLMNLILREDFREIQADESAKFCRRMRS